MVQPQDQQKSVHKHKFKVMLQAVAHVIEGCGSQSVFGFFRLFTTSRCGWKLLELAMVVLASVPLLWACAWRQINISYY